MAAQTRRGLVVGVAAEASAVEGRLRGLSRDHRVLALSAAQAEPEVLRRLAARGAGCVWIDAAVDAREADPGELERRELERRELERRELERRELDPIEQERREPSGEEDPHHMHGATPAATHRGTPATRVAQAAADAGLPVVLSAPPREGLEDLRRVFEERSVALLVGGPGVGSLTLARLAGAARAARERPEAAPEGQLGRLQRLVVREPGGRRVRRAASRRTPFGADGRVRWDLDDAELDRVRRAAAPLWRVAEAIVPGAAERLAVSELIGDRASPGGASARLVAHGRVEDIACCVELDREIRGDEEWEVEATFERGTLLARFCEGRGVLIRRAPLRKDDAEPEAGRADELLVRHLLSHPRRPAIGTAAELCDSVRACERALRRAPTVRDTRPLRIVLVHVPRFRNRYDELRIPSLAVARLAAYLRGYGFDVRVVDLEATSATPGSRPPLGPFTDDERVEAWLRGADDAALAEPIEAMWPALDAAIEGPCLVGFSIVDYFGHFQMNLASCLARRVRERTGQPTVLGGERDQVDGERALAPHMPFDYVVDGDGEGALHELACLAAYGDRDARFIEAVWSRRQGALIKNGIVRSHLNAMPRPDFGGMPLDRYRRRPSATLLGALARDGVALPAPAEASFYLPYGFVKGCVADCTFCSAKEHLDVQAPEKTVDELLALSERHGTRDFVFLNNLVNLSPKWLRRFCDRLIEARADLQWTDSCRPTGIDDELAAQMREAGCLLLNFGAESGSDTILARMQKGLTRADILGTLRATHRAGILNRVNLIAGYFHETERDVDQTISLVEELSEQIDLIGCFQGFYLFEGMGVDPEREGIVLRPELDRLKTGQQTLAYDELGGLAWEDKRERIDTSRNRILSRIEELGIRTIDKIDEHDLFWISRTFRDAALTRRYVLAPPDPAPARAALPPGGVRGRAG